MAKQMAKVVRRILYNCFCYNSGHVHPLFGFLVLQNRCALTQNNIIETDGCDMLFIDRPGWPGRLDFVRGSRLTRWASTTCHKDSAKIQKPLRGQGLPMRNQTTRAALSQSPSAIKGLFKAVHRQVRPAL